jgi:internalin A
MGDGHESQARVLVEALRRAVFAFKRGPREVAAALAAILLIAARSQVKEYVPRLVSTEPARSIVTWVPTGLAALLLLYVVVRIWRQAAPLPVSSASSLASSIRGPMAFTEEHTELFRRLGREDEIAKLASLVRDDQIPVVVLVGESGAGKTSLLRAGLTGALAGSNQTLIYWAAVANDPEARLVHAIDAAGVEGASLATLAGLPRTCSARRRLVLVLDQFEQLSPDRPGDRPIFNLVREALTAPAPHFLKVVIAFRRDYYPSWRDFERELDSSASPGQARGARPVDVPLRLFTRAKAADVIATVAEAAQIKVTEALVTTIVDSIRNRDDRVSPVDIGISMMAVGELAAQKPNRELDVADYRFAGGADGLASEYISSHLDRLAEDERRAVLKALLALADLDTNQRLPEGRSAAELATIAGWPAERLARTLDFLAGPGVRVLEQAEQQDPDGSPAPHFRLPHERLIPALRGLAGRVLEDVDRARIVFERAYRLWADNDRRPRFLLAGPELRQVERQRAQLAPPGEPGERESFLKSSLGRRKLRRLVAAGTAALAMAAAGWAARASLHELDRRDLVAWGLPGDLLDVQEQLDSLKIDAPVTNLRWLTDNVRVVSIRSEHLREIDAVPGGVEELSCDCPNLEAIHTLDGGGRLRTLTLVVGDSSVLRGIEKLTGLTSLSIESDELESLGGIEKLTGLTSLSIESDKLQTLGGIQKLTGLTSLSIESDELKSQAGIEKLTGLTSLSIAIDRLDSLGEIEKLTGLTSLSIERDELRSLAGIEKLTGLTSLSIAIDELKSLSEIQKLTGLTSLSVRGRAPNALAGIEKLTGLTSLAIESYSSQSLAEIGRLSGLTSLSVWVPWESLAGIDKLIRLTSLTIRTSLIELPRINKRRYRVPYSIQSPLKSLAGIEKLTGLTSLSIESYGLKSLGEIEKLTGLTSLSIKSHKLESLAGIEKLTGLTSLSVNGILKSLAGIEKLNRLSSLSLSRCGAPLASLDRLKDLSHLETIDLGSCRVMTLVGLPRSTKALALRVN